MASSKEQAEVIRKIIPTGSLIAVNHAGFLPYFLPEYRFIDMTGLNDHHIAHTASGALHQKYDPEYVCPNLPVPFCFIGEPLRRRQHAGWTGLLGRRKPHWQPTQIFRAIIRFWGDYWIRKGSGGSTVYAILSIRR